MPQVNRALMLQLGIILLIVPAQYFITQHWKPPSAEKQQQNVKTLVKQFKTWKSKILSKATWQKWFKDTQDYFLNYKDIAVERAKSYTTSSPSPNTYEEGVEVELEPSERAILTNRDAGGNFAASAVPRNPRPSSVKYRIGQVIRHKTYGYRGVIVGWDATAKAPEGWLDTMHGKNRPPPSTPYYAVLVDINYEFYEDGATVYLAQESFSLVTADTMHLRLLPNYSVLVDVRDRKGPQITYVVEENIEIITGHEVNHPQVKDYFNGFDGVQYIAKQWLKKIYPHDQ